jgi:threonine synthase
LSDQKFSSEHHLLSLNSINWGRILMQTVHFIFSFYFAAKRLGDETFGQEVEIAVPTGACGNITGSRLSHKSVMLEVD